MQIQRIQNLYLAIAFIAAIVSLNFNWLSTGDTFVTIQNNIPLLILTLLATILPMMGICLYRNLRRQKLVARLSGLFVIFTLGYIVALSYLGPDPDAKVCLLAPCCIALSGILDGLAARAIVHDEKLLKSADRLR